MSHSGAQAPTRRQLTALWHIGTMMPCAPESSTRLTIHHSSAGTRMIGLTPEDAMNWFSCREHIPHHAAGPYDHVILVGDVSMLRVDEDEVEPRLDSESLGQSVTWQTGR